MGIFRRHKKNKGMGIGLADSTRRTPLRANQQKSPEPERLIRPDEEADMAVHQLKEPPKAEG